MMSDDEIIAVVQAHKEGKRIECFHPYNNSWKPVVNMEGHWNFCEWKFRVAPEPRKPREWYVRVNNCSRITSGFNTKENPYDGAGFQWVEKSKDDEIIRVREIIE